MLGIDSSQITTCHFHVSIKKCFSVKQHYRGNQVTDITSKIVGSFLCGRYRVTIFQKSFYNSRNGCKLTYIYALLCVTDICFV